MKSFRYPSAQSSNSNLLILISILLLFTCGFSCSKDSKGGENTKKEINPDIWIDPAMPDAVQNEFVVVWFKDQFLSEAGSFLSRQGEFSGMGRSQMSQQVISSLKTLSEKSHTTAEDALQSLVDQGLITDLRKHWIINGFSCQILGEDLIELSHIPGVDRIFLKLFTDSGDQSSNGPNFIQTPSEVISSPLPQATWNIEAIGAKRVWEEFGVMGEGVLNVVHDFGFRLDIPAIQGSIFRNNTEIPGNGIDDDANGFIDDYHGYNFDLESSKINNRLDPDGLNHGSVVASLICGQIASDSVIGVAPNASWSPVRGFLNFEQMVEWSIEQGADTYSMSFSVPNMGEFRSHWRKIFEQATYCGLYFVSGAGNFANPNNGNYVAVPRQMRNPEDVPGAVFGVAGVGPQEQRPVFSSQGPVIWDTEYYNEGQVNKPDFATYNNQLSFVSYINGELQRQTQGNSFAGPHLTGVLALLLSADPDLLPWEAYEVLKNTAKDLGDPGFDFQHGHGLVDAYEAVKAVR